jgi:hypothetical protein
MYTYRQKGVVRIQVGVLNREHFPYTTDVVFGRKGHEITFTVEKDDFIPTPVPVEDHKSKDDKGNSMEGKPENANEQNKDKKQKSGNVSKTAASSSAGPLVFKGG